jgi:hypothetical protein
LNIEHSSRLWLPRTGQTTSYADGDDGYFQTGNPRKTRFIDNLNGTISDRATGLMWVKQPELILPGAPVAGIPTNQIQVAHGNWANNHPYDLADKCKPTGSSTYWVCVVAHTSAATGTFADDRAGAAAGKWRQTVWTSASSLLDVAAAMSWANAVANCLALEYAGFADWRLPHRTEFESILDHESDVDPMTYPDSVVLQAVSQYWTGTTWKFSTDTAFAISTDGSLNEPIDKTNGCYVLPVRGGRINA